MLSVLTLGIRSFHIADDRLPTVIDVDVDVLDADVLVSTVT